MIHRDLLHSKDKDLVRTIYPNIGKYYKQKREAYHKFVQTAFIVKQELEKYTEEDIIDLVGYFIETQDASLGKLLVSENLASQMDSRRVANIFARLALGNGDR